MSPMRGRRWVLCSVAAAVALIAAAVSIGGSSGGPSRQRANRPTGAAVIRRPGGKSVARDEGAGEKGPEGREGEEGEGEPESRVPDSLLASRAFPYKAVPFSFVRSARVRASSLPVAHANAERGVPQPADLARQGGEKGLRRGSPQGVRTSLGADTDTAPEVLANPTWGSIGPQPTYERNGFTVLYGGTPPWAGRVSALAADPTNA